MLSLARDVCPFGERRGSTVDTGRAHSPATPRNRPRSPAVERSSIHPRCSEPPHGRLSVPGKGRLFPRREQRLGGDGEDVGEGLWFDPEERARPLAGCPNRLPPGLEKIPQEILAKPGLTEAAGPCDGLDPR